MSRQSKQRRTLALARHFTAVRKSGQRTHNTLSRRQTNSDTRVQHTAKATVPTVATNKRKTTITHKTH